MRQTISYNSELDIQEVDQFGYIDIAKANASSVIDVPIELQDERYNGIEDPRSIAGRPSDQFELAQAARAVNDYSPSKPDSQTPSE